MSIDWHSVLMDIHIHLFGVYAVFIVLDIVSGVISAIMTTGLSSRVMYHGLWGKCAGMIALITAGMVDYVITHVTELGINAPIYLLVGSYLIVMETVSILENVVKANPELQAIARFFPQNKDSAPHTGDANPS